MNQSLEEFKGYYFSVAIDNELYLCPSLWNSINTMELYFGPIILDSE